MINKSISTTQKIDLLIDLLNAEQLERWELGKSLHAKCSNPAAIKRFLEVAVKKFDKGTLKASDFEHLIQITNIMHEEFRELQYKVFPAGSRYNGLVHEIQKEIKIYRKKYKTPIEFTCIFNKDLNIRVVKEVAISNICSEIIKYFCAIKATHITVRMELLNNRTLQLEVHSINNPEEGRKEIKFNRNLSLINAKLIWQNAKVLPETNWIDCVAIDFDRLQEE